jgi:hypothetical protein
MFTLFVVPSVYVALAKDHRGERAKEPDANLDDAPEEPHSAIHDVGSAVGA